jgi:hypothetical protein
VNVISFKLSRAAIASLWPAIARSQRRSKNCQKPVSPIVSFLNFLYAPPKVKRKIISDCRLGVVHWLSTFIHSIHLAKWRLGGHVRQLTVPDCLLCVLMAIGY